MHESCDAKGGGDGAGAWDVLLCNKKTWIFSELKGVTAKVRHAPDGQVKNLSTCQSKPVNRQYC